MKLVIGALLFGDYSELAERCLSSLTSTLAEAGCQDKVLEMRLGLNQCSPAALQYVASWQSSCPWPVRTYTPDRAGVGKWALMRRMLYHDPALPDQATHWLWLDDDTHALPAAVTFWPAFLEKLDHYDLAGFPYRILRRSGQADGIRAQPWCRSVTLTPQFHFMQGGFWAARLACLQQWDFPFREISHNGGDSMLGELAMQQRWRRLVLTERTTPIRSNDAPRRGISDSVWPWQGYPRQEPDYSHHQFDVKEYAHATRDPSPFTGRAG